MAHECENSGNGASGTGAFLSGRDLQDLIDEKDAIHIAKDANQNDTDEFKFESDDWTVDLSLGEEVFLSSDDEIRILDNHESVAIDPGEFALLITEEIVKIPCDKAAFISLKFSIARKGLINISGFHVDPNYKGRLIFSVYNASPSPVILRRGEDVFMIVFANLTQDISDNREDANFMDISRLQPKWLTGLQGRTASLEKLDNDVTQLQQRVRILAAILTGIVATLLGFIATQALL